MNQYPQLYLDICKDSRHSGCDSPLEQQGNLGSISRNSELAKAICFSGLCLAARAPSYQQWTGAYYCTTADPQQQTHGAPLVYVCMKWLSYKMLLASLDAKKDVIETATTLGALDDINDQCFVDLAHTTVVITARARESAPVDSIGAFQTGLKLSSCSCIPPYTRVSAAFTSHLTLPVQCPWLLCRQLRASS